MVPTEFVFSGPRFDAEYVIWTVCLRKTCVYIVVNPASVTAFRKASGAGLEARALLYVYPYSWGPCGCQSPEWTSALKPDIRFPTTGRAHY
jgi:hypothetical protein